MRRELIERKPVRKPRRHLEVLPLDPRDPQIARAKDLVYPRSRPRHRAA